MAQASQCSQFLPSKDEEQSRAMYAIASVVTADQKKKYESTFQFQVYTKIKYTPKRLRTIYDF